MHARVAVHSRARRRPRRARAAVRRCTRTRPGDHRRVEDWTVAAQIAPSAGGRPRRRLREQLAALEMLADARPPGWNGRSREHIDTCTYRFDAWRLGFVSLQLEPCVPRARRPGGRRRAHGIHLGAYAWLEDLRPDPRELTPVRAAVRPGEGLRPGGRPAARARQHQRRATSTRRRSTTPSPRPCCATATWPTPTPDTPDALAVNLSSDRVRTRAGHARGDPQRAEPRRAAGLPLERGLHDRHPGGRGRPLHLPVAQGIPAARPTSSPRRPPTRACSIEAVDARNVARRPRRSSRMSRKTGDATLSRSA